MLMAAGMTMEHAVGWPDEMRRGIDGVVYPTIEAKVAAVEAILAELDTDPARIKQLTRWHWIEANLHDLPQKHAA